MILFITLLVVGDICWVVGSFQVRSSSYLPFLALTAPQMCFMFCLHNIAHPPSFYSKVSCRPYWKIAA